MDKCIIKSVCIDHQNLSPLIYDILLINAKKARKCYEKKYGKIKEITS